jgi:hypothetical protein
MRALCSMDWIAFDIWLRMRIFRTRDTIDGTWMACDMFNLLTIVVFFLHLSIVTAVQ